MVKVSIIVPVYNVGEYLRPCVESLLSQTMKEIEIILVDDGSKDDSPAICDEYKERDQRVVVIHQKNQGVSVARNCGIEVSKGKWITFVDGDDWADPQLCEKTVSFAEGTDSDVLIFSYYTSYSNKEVRSKLIDLSNGDVTDQKDLIIKKTISQYYGGNVANNGVSTGTTWGKLIRKSEIEENGLSFRPGLTRAQDTVFWLRGFECAKKISFLDEPLYHYRITDTSVCSGTKYLPECEKPFGMLLDEYKRFIVEYSKDEDYQDALNLRTIQVLSWHVKHKYFHENYKGSVSQKVNDFRQLCKKQYYKNAISEVNVSRLPRSLKLLIICCRCRLYYTYYALYQYISSHSNRTEAT